MSTYEAGLIQDISDTKNRIMELQSIEALNTALIALKKDKNFKLVFADTLLGTSLMDALHKLGSSAKGTLTHDLAGSFIDGCAVLVKYMQDIQDSSKIGKTAIEELKENLAVQEAELASYRGGTYE